MPFTLSHPAIVLPFRKYFSVTGLVFGSMSPDFEYFIRMQIKNEIGHTIVGILVFCLPMSILFSFIFHYGIKVSLIQNCPLFLKRRWQGFEDFDWGIYFKKNWLNVVISIMIGSFSHIFWDSFTHYDGVIVYHFPILQIEIYKIEIYRILQHSSSFLGALYIFYIVYRLPKTKIINCPNGYYWLKITLLTMIMVGVRFLFLPISLGNFIVTVMMSVFISLSIVPILNRFTN